MIFCFYLLKKLIFEIYEKKLRDFDALDEILEQQVEYIIIVGKNINLPDNDFVIARRGKLMRYS